MKEDFYLKKALSTISNERKKSIFNHPIYVGMMIIFVFLFCFSTINALWYQPCEHPAPLFHTRFFDKALCANPSVSQHKNTLQPQKMILQIKQNNQSVSKQKGIQERIKEDMVIQKKSDLVENKSKKRFDTSIIKSKNENSIFLQEYNENSQSFIKKIQICLQKFGNKEIIANGILDLKTRSAILEFQGIFGLPETGEIDFFLYQKMKEVFLIQ